MFHTFVRLGDRKEVPSMHGAFYTNAFIAIERAYVPQGPIASFV